MLEAHPARERILEMGEKMTDNFGLSTFENRTCQCFILSGQVEVDQAVADTRVDGPSTYSST